MVAPKINTSSILEISVASIEINPNLILDVVYKFSMVVQRFCRRAVHAVHRAQKLAARSRSVPSRTEAFFRRLLFCDRWARVQKLIDHATGRVAIGRGRNWGGQLITRGFSSCVCKPAVQPHVLVNV